MVSIFGSQNPPKRNQSHQNKKIRIIENEMNWIRQIWLLLQSLAAKTCPEGIKVTKPEDQNYRIEMIWISQIWLLFQALAAKTCPKGIKPKINKVSAWPRNRPDRTGPDRSSRPRTGPDRARPVHPSHTGMSWPCTWGFLNKTNIWDHPKKNNHQQKVNIKTNKRNIHLLIITTFFQQKVNKKSFGGKIPTCQPSTSWVWNIHQYNYHKISLGVQIVHVSSNWSKKPKKTQRHDNANEKTYETCSDLQDFISSTKFLRGTFWAFNGFYGLPNPRNPGPGFMEPKCPMRFGYKWTPNEVRHHLRIWRLIDAQGGILVGAFNPSEKYACQIGESFPKIFGMKTPKIFETTT